MDKIPIRQKPTSSQHLTLWTGCKLRDELLCIVQLLYRICDGLSGTDVNSSSSTSMLPYQTSFHQNSVYPIPEVYGMLDQSAWYHSLGPQLVLHFLLGNSLDSEKGSAFVLIQDTLFVLYSGAVVAREYGLPCIVGCQDATRIFSTGLYVQKLRPILRHICTWWLCHRIINQYD